MDFLAPVTGKHENCLEYSLVTRESFSLNCVPAGPEKLPVQSVSRGWPEDPHGDGPQLHQHSQM